VWGARQGHTRAVHSVAISSDGSQVVSGSADKTLRLWDMASGHCTRCTTFEVHDAIRPLVEASRVAGPLEGRAPEQRSCL
jgi:WD40 repeat protein